MSAVQEDEAPRANLRGRAIGSSAQWKLCTFENGGPLLPADAVDFGNGHFASRLVYQGGLHVGFVQRGKMGVTVSYGGEALSFLEPFEVLCGEVRFRLYDGTSSAILGGWEANGEDIWVGRIAHVPGKVCSGALNYASEFQETNCAEGFEIAYATTSDFDALYNSLRKSQLLPEEKKPPAKPCVLKNIKALLAWEPSADGEVPATLTVPLNTDKLRNNSKPQLLMCHDMKGGYCPDADENYLKVFAGWDSIDQFVYFAHYRVSMPPRIWINACHERGIPCLGTLITEHNGRKENDLLFQDIERSARQLARLCQHYGFDGYLVNLESGVPSFSKAVDFVRELSKECKTLLGQERAFTIYYDTLDSRGFVRYQNALTHENEAMLHVCDAVMTNYWWTETHLANSLILAGEKQTQVYMGIDMFARNTSYGPGRNARQAIRKVKEYGLSLALFAPGWNVECGSAGTGNVEHDKTDEGAFWDYVLDRKAGE